MQLLFDRLFPRMCVFCDLSESSSGICDLCLSLLPVNDNFCCRCGQPLDAPGATGIPCGACQTSAPNFDLARAPFRYGFPIDAALKKLKFKRKLVFAPPLAGLLATEIDRNFPDCDALVPVPLNHWRQVRRGFNQADELCKTLTKHTGLPLFLQTARPRATAFQSGLTAAERASNVGGAFVIRKRMPYRFPLIVDDVMTTGATCNELAKELRSAGAERVGVIAVARSSGL